MSENERAEGFTLIELMVVVLLIGILVSIAVPIYLEVEGRASERSCFASQRTLEGAAMQWESVTGDRLRSDLAGIVTVTHPLLVDHLVARPPTCPSAPAPADPTAPTVAEGAYTFNGTGDVVACTHGTLSAHGHF